VIEPSGRKKGWVLLQKHPKKNYGVTVKKEGVGEGEFRPKFGPRTPGEQVCIQATLLGGEFTES